MVTTRLPVDLAKLIERWRAEQALAGVQMLSFQGAVELLLRRAFDRPSNGGEG